MTEKTETKERSKRLTTLKSLDGQPASFTVPVEVTRRDGTKALVEFTCQTMGKRAWSAVQQRYMNESLDRRKDEEEFDSDAKKSEASVRSFADNVATAMAENARMAMECATAWNLPEPFTRENLEALEDIFPNTLSELLAAYGKAVYQGQLGN